MYPLQGSESCRYGITVEGHAQPTVRALDMPRDSSLLLLGGDAGGQGVVGLYRTRDNALLATWPQTKPIWTVAMSPEGRLAAVGGFGMELKLYSTTSFDLLQSVRYIPMRGPAFVYHCSFAANAIFLAAAKLRASLGFGP